MRRVLVVLTILFFCASNIASAAMLCCLHSGTDNTQIVIDQSSDMADMPCHDLIPDGDTDLSSSASSMADCQCEGCAQFSGSIESLNDSSFLSFSYVAPKPNQIPNVELARIKHPPRFNA